MTIINIGFEGSPKATLNAVKSYFDIINVEVRVSEYKGIKERCLVLKVKDKDSTKKTLQKLCILLDEECISFKKYGIGKIAFNPTYKGQKITFDEKYFKEV